MYEPYQNIVTEQEGRWVLTDYRNLEKSLRARKGFPCVDGTFRSFS